MSPPHLYFFKIIWATLSPLSKDSDKLGYSFALRSFLVPSKTGWQLSQCFWFPEPPSEEWAVWGRSVLDHSCAPLRMSPSLLPKGRLSDEYLFFVLFLSSSPFYYLINFIFDCIESSLWCVGFLLRWFLLLWTTGVRSCGSWA